MQTYQIGSNSGYMGPVFEASDDDSARKIAAQSPYFEDVLDVIDWQDEQGNLVALLVVADV